MPNTRRALALLSGGLDSTIAIKLMLDQGIQVVAVNFTSPFCTCSGRKREGCHLASQVAETLGVRIRLVHKGMEYLRIVEHPRYGHGKGLNPCIDCRIFMLKKAALIMEEENASFVVTGEVLGQRPMSQRMDAIALIERESGLKGRIVRPLSAHFLEPTIPEQNGMVDRVRLLHIQGRSRKAQFAFAKERKLSVFGCPAGGCLLTDPSIAARMRDLFQNKPDYDLHDAQLTTIGRHFRININLKVILGRDEKENAKLALMAKQYPIAEFVDIPGPTAVICGTMTNEDMESIAGLMRHYSKHSSHGPSLIIFKNGNDSFTHLSSACWDEPKFDSCRI